MLWLRDAAIALSTYGALFFFIDVSDMNVGELPYQINKAVNVLNIPCAPHYLASI